MGTSGAQRTARAEVAHDRDPAPLRDDGRRIELPGRVAGLVPERLPVRADRPHIRARNAGVAHHPDGRVGKPLAEVGGQPAVLARRAMVHCRLQARALRRRIFVDVKSEELRTVVRPPGRRDAHDRR
jgi:hypothetical protein